MPAAGGVLDLPLGVGVLQRGFFSWKQILISPRAVMDKSLAVRDMVTDGCGCGETDSRSLVFCHVEVGLRICLWDLESKEQCLPARYTDPYLSGGVRGKALVVRDSKSLIFKALYISLNKHQIQSSIQG